MAEYSVSDYGIFSDAVSTTNTFNTSISNLKEAIQSAKQALSGGIFEGPIQENCMSVFASLDADIESIASNIAAIASYITSTSSNYQAGDQAASQEILGATSETSTITENNTPPNSNMTSYQIEGRNFNVVNTKIPIGTYEQYVQKNKINQNAGLLPNDCMLLSQYYAKDLLTGKYTSKSAIQSRSGAPAVRLNERCRSENEEVVKDYTYKELTEGHPVVLQVTQVNSYKGARHLVTAVGYSSNVKSSKDLTPDNILVLDCVDGEIQTLSKARSEGGHERKLFAQGGYYQALGPTEEFLAKEVNTGTKTTTA